MKHIMWLILAVALAAACGDGGGNTPDSGTPVTPPVDSGTPANDGSAQPDSPITPPPEDAAVPQDAGAIEDVIATSDTPMASTECWSQACGNQWLVTEGADSARMVTMTCDMAGRRISLSPTGTGCVATCSGDSCSCTPDDVEDGYSEVLQNQREADGSCGMQSRIIPMQNGMPMPSTRRLVRRE